MAGGRKCKTVKIHKDLGEAYDLLEVNAEGSQLEHYLSIGYTIGDLPESDSDADEEEQESDLLFSDELQEDGDISEDELEETQPPVAEKPAPKKSKRR